MIFISNLNSRKWLIRNHPDKSANGGVQKFIISVFNDVLMSPDTKVSKHFLSNVVVLSNFDCTCLQCITRKAKKKRKVVGCPSLPAPTFKNWRKVFTVQKYTAPNFSEFQKKFCFSLRNLIF